MSFSINSLGFKLKALFLFIHLITSYGCYAEEITPYKFTDSLPYYEIPASSRFAVNRPEVGAPDVIGYFSAPKSDRYPIAILCGGSSSAGDVQSIIHVHRYLLQEFLDLNVAVVTLEQRGVNGNEINVEEFIEHYTRSNRLKDHQLAVDYLTLNPPKGWNGNFIFLGVSEGGPIVTSLTGLYSSNTLATVKLVRRWRLVMEGRTMGVYATIDCRQSGVFSSIETSRLLHLFSTNHFQTPL